jgi:predicted DNA-binding protein
MEDPLVVVSVRIPKSVAERAKWLAATQERTIQATYARALRVGMDLEEEYARIACEAIEDTKRRQQARPAPGIGEVGE